MPWHEQAPIGCKAEAIPTWGTPEDPRTNRLSSANLVRTYGGSRRSLHFIELDGLETNGEKFIAPLGPRGRETPDR